MKIRRSISFLLAMVMLVSLLPASVFAAEEKTNIALGKTVTASSSFNEIYTADKMVDGNTVDDTGRWNSQATSGAEWVLLDLEGVYAITEVSLNWWAYGNVAGTVVVSVSCDGANYEPVEELTGNLNVASNTFVFENAVSARYIKFDFDHAPDVWGYSLSEIQVYGTVDPNYTNVALGKAVTASSSYNEFYTPDKIVDGNTVDDAGRWNSQATTAEEWVQIDLGKITDVHEIRLSWWDWGTVAGTIVVYSSKDGTNFEQIGSVQDNINVAENVFLLNTPVQARYIKLVLGAAANVWGYSLKEVAVYGLVDPDYTNVALGKTVTASSSFNEIYTPDKMVDGNTADDAGRWNSQATGGAEWVLLDLEGVYDITEVNLNWWAYGNVAGTVVVSVSCDGATYEPVGELTDNLNVNSNTFVIEDAVSARYIKFDFDHAADVWGYSLSEIQVYGKVDPDYTNVALGKAVTASSSYNEFYTPDKIVDGNAVDDAGRWNSQATTAEEWVQIDLGKISDVHEIRLSWWDWGTVAGTIVVYGSKDGTNFEQIGSVQDNINVAENVFLLNTPVQARYIKLVLGAAANVWGYSLKEVEVYAIPGEDMVAFADGQYYTTVNEAILAAGEAPVKILANTEEAITVSADVTIDLAGCKLSNVTVAEGALLSLADTVGGGSAAVIGNVPTMTEADGKSYYVSNENGVYSAHSYAIKLTHISLDPTNDALGYKAELIGDDVVKAHVKSIGFNLWVSEDMVVTKTIDGKTAATLRLKNILKSGGGEMTVYGNAFVIFDNEQTVISADYGTTMKEVLQAVDAAWETFAHAQREAAKALCDRYYDTVSGWELTNIYPET